MLIDQSSLLLAIGFSAAALCIALLIGWLTARGESYQLTFSAGIMVIVIGVVFYLRYTVDAALVFGGLSFSSLTLGFAILWGAAYQFRTDRLPYLPLLTAVVVTETPLIMAFAMGYDGMGAGLLDLWVFLFMSAMTWNYWLARKEAPIQIRSLCVVFALTALSFLACAIASLFLKPLYGAGPPSGLVEDINNLVSIIGLTGAGALSLALNQSRLARRHKRDAMTDSLTGLMNRRALFEQHGTLPLPAHTGVLVFDLDHFKDINDRFGHAMGDQVLMRFARALQDSLDPQDVAARIGGEEFVLVMRRATPDIAVLVAERVRARFSLEVFESETGPQRYTVSAGVAYAENEGESFDAMLARADTALYGAKRAGRNRVGSPGLKLVA
jgi:diguanylate cyclase (GGDEF)-like protein